MCLWCGVSLQLGRDGRWHGSFREVKCGEFRYHHPNLDIPRPRVLAEPSSLEKWLRA